MSKHDVRSFHHDFAKRWVSMDRQRQVFQRCRHFHSQAHFRDQVGRFRADDLGTEHDAGIRISYDFDEAFRVAAEGECASVRRIWNLPALTLWPFSFASASDKLRLRIPDR